MAATSLETRTLKIEKFSPTKNVDYDQYFFLARIN